jgi:hypothetical protein
LWVAVAMQWVETILTPLLSPLEVLCIGENMGPWGRHSKHLGHSLALQSNWSKIWEVKGVDTCQCLCCKGWQNIQHIDFHPC